MKTAWIACVALAAAAAGAPAHAWHAKGHLMTAEVAWRRMDKGSRCRAAKILRAGKIYGLSTQGPGVPPVSEKLFVTSATWPDRIKQLVHAYHNDGEEPTGPGAGQNIGSSDKLMHKYWHYVDFPIPDDPNKPPAGVNALERIKLLRDTLADPNASMDVKAYDLAWLIHLVGDVHQPLHTATKYDPVFNGGKDAGGNSVDVRVPNPHPTPAHPTLKSNLHSWWDGAPGKDDDDLADAVKSARLLAAPQQAEVDKADPADWVTESHALADAEVYVDPIVRKQKGPFTLTAGYVSTGTATSKAQVALGGYRLGKLLDTALTWPDKTCDK